MKRKVLIPILLLVNLCVMMIACSSEEEYIQPDSIPAYFYIEILNEDGSNLLDPKTENNLWEKGNVTIIWNDEEYELNAKTKSGAVYVESPDFGNGLCYLLGFYFAYGTIEMPTEIVMIWGDGSQNTVVFDYYDYEKGEHREAINCKEGEKSRFWVLTMVLADDNTKKGGTI